MDDEVVALKPTPDPLKSLGPIVLVGYLLTRPPVLAVARFIVWLARLLFRPIHLGFHSVKARVRRRPGAAPLKPE